MASLRIAFATVLFTIGVVAAIPSSLSGDGVRVSMNADDSTSMGSNMKLMFRIYSECTTNDNGLLPCLKMRAINFFDRVSKVDNIPLVESVSLIRVPAEGEDRTARALTESEIESTLPKEAEERDSALTTLLLDRVARFFRTHTMQVALPEVSETDLSRSLEEGRGKMKKMMGMMMMMGGFMKVALIMMLKLKGLFFLAKKALIISKIALVLALIGVLRKMMGGGGGGHESSGWSSAGSSSGWNRRSSAHDIAYNAYRPATSS